MKTTIDIPGQEPKETRAGLIVVLNCFAELKRLVPTEN